MYKHKTSLMAIALYLSLVGLSFAVEAPVDLWKGLIGEAVSEGYNGMYAVACVYRNRLENNMPLGCVAMNKEKLDEFVADQGQHYESISKEIISLVFDQGSPDTTRGATHYENIEAFGIPYWASSMHITVKLGNHTFYKKE